MRGKTTWFLLVAVLSLAACANESEEHRGPRPPAGKGLVTRSDLIGRHAVRATGGSDGAFLWDFTETDFTIAKDGTKPIPADVRAAVAHTDADVIRIDGKWTLADRELVLTDLQVTLTDGVRGPGAPDVTLTPFRTPVVRFELAGRQYVLGPR